MEKSNSPFADIAKWISHPGRCRASNHYPVQPAPYLRKVFHLDHPLKNARIHICGLGYYELYLNGKRVGDQVLDPAPAQYDRRVRYVTHRVELAAGENTLGVILGNGWYNNYDDTWHFESAPWSDYPKMLLQLEDDHGTVCVSDTSWRVSTGAIVYDSLRGGETYDARLEPAGWLKPDFDDSKWDKVRIAASPGGIITPQYQPPCKIMSTRKAADSWRTDSGSTVYDTGQNLAGWAKIQVRAAAGAKFTLKYSELIDERRNIERSHITCHCHGPFQTDTFIAAGEGIETFEARFTYHGFRYVEVEVEGEGTIADLEIQVVYTAFDTIGRFKSSDETLNELQKCTWWAYVGNFVGIPTDCPHREKNGWTGDALLAAETGLFNFDASSAYRQWMESFRDVQRPSGQLPGIVPSGGWGFNWGSGPAWDSAFIMIPWYIYLYTGDSTVIAENYECMKLYLDYCASMSEDFILDFGLGDWCQYDPKRITPVAVTSTGYYYCDVTTVAKCAAILGFEDDAKKYWTLAASIKTSFNKHFYKGGGVYADDSVTALACALYHGLADDSECGCTAANLAEKVRAVDCIADFGILGAKYTPRVLADYGYIDLAYSMITQDKYPGWGYWLKQGATTLWESWNGDCSQNHIMFGDISAWMYQYLGGITPLEESPGFKHFRIAPRLPAGLETVDAEHRGIASRWVRGERDFKLEIVVPKGCTAEVVMPDGQVYQAGAGKSFYECEVKS